MPKALQKEEKFGKKSFIFGFVEYSPRFLSIGLAFPTDKFPMITETHQFDDEPAIFHGLFSLSPTLFLPIECVCVCVFFVFFSLANSIVW